MGSDGYPTVLLYVDGVKIEEYMGDNDVGPLMEYLENLQSKYSDQSAAATSLMTVAPVEKVAVSKKVVSESPSSQAGNVEDNVRVPLKFL